jgi:uncharacterized protein YifE (UPF0438 family)
MIQLRFVILGIAALAFVPLPAVAQSPAQPGVKAGEQAEPTTRSEQYFIDAFNREHDRANANEREMNKWHNQEIQSEEKIHQLEGQLNYERQQQRPQRPYQSNDD